MATAKPDATLTTLGSAILVLLALAGCESQSKGFALPPGDAAKGKVEFVNLGCNQCHRIDGSIERAVDSAYPEVDVRLGGRVSRIKTYGELVTADGRSKMPDYNEAMTVSQLVDVTTFLQQTYVLYVPEYRPIFMP